MSAPIIAWLIDFGYVANEAGVLEVTTLGWYHLREARNTASRSLQNMKPVPVPPRRERLIKRERL
jgi:hypothetical protein